MPHKPLLDQSQAAVTPAERAEATRRLEHSVVAGNMRTMGLAAAGAVILSVSVATANEWMGVGVGAGLWLWLALVLLTLAHGAWTSRRMRGRGWADPQFPALRAHFLYGGAVSAAAWGLASWLLLPTPSTVAEVFVTVTVAMVCVAAGGTMAGFARCLWLYTAVIVSVFGAGLLWQGGSEEAGLALAFAVLGALAISNARRIENALRATLYANFSLAAERQDTLQAHREAEAARRSAELANAAKTAFLAAAGHDLRQPMHALQQYLAHIHRSNRDAALAPAIAGADQAFSALNDLLDAVLEVSRLMLGSVRPDPETFDLQPLFTRLDAQLRPYAEQKGLSMTVHCPEGSYLHADPLLLERVLRNLALNAIKFTHRGGVHLRVRSGPQGLRLLVADSGVGIASADLARVFEPFVQLGNPARRRDQGLGLGLAIVRDLTQLLGIPLRVRSRPGRGTLFRLTCPRPDEHHVRRLRASDRAAPDLLQGSFIVLIDDDAMSLQATAFTLSESGCRTLTAASSDAALEALAEVDDLPHAIVSDFRLEAETGLAAIARLKGAFAQRFGDELDVAALLISGDTSPEEFERVEAAGYRLLRKPLAPADLRRELSELLRRAFKGPSSWD